jgi:hypothetical protein
VHEQKLRTQQHLSEYRPQFDAGMTFTSRLTGCPESAGTLTTIGLIPPTKTAKRASAVAANGTHEVIWPHRTMLVL